MAISYWPKSWIQRPTIWETVNVYVLVRSKSPRIQLPCRLAPECQYLFQSWFTKFKGMHIHISLETIVCGYYGMWFEYSFFFETSRTDLAATIEAGILLDLKKIWIGTRLTPAFTGTPLLDMEFDHHYVSTLQTFMNPWTKKFRSFMKKNSDTICVFFCERFLIKVIHCSSPPNPPTSATPQSLPTSSICRAASRSDHVAKMPSWGSKMSSCKAWLKLSSVCGLQTQQRDLWNLGFIWCIYGPLALEKGNTWQRWNLKNLYFCPNWLRKDLKSNVSSYKWLKC